MQLPKTKVPASRQNPRLLTLFGQSKVGKTTTLASLEGCLIIDTERGSDTIDAMKVNATSFKEFNEIYKELVRLKKEEDHTYPYIALDTLDVLVDWVEKGVCAKEGVQTLSDIPYGGGWSMVRTTTMKWIQKLLGVTDHLILIGHRKKALLGTEDVATFSTSSLDLSGKLKNVIMAESDAIGYVYRTKDEVDEKGKVVKKGELRVSFESSDELEAGARAPHLRGKHIPFVWDKIFIDKQN